MQLAQLAAEEGDLDAQREQLTIQITRRQELLRQMDGGDRAAEAQEQMQGLLARLRTDAEEFIRLRLASVLLKRAIERYREKNQGPVLQRASRTFAALTLGSFCGLRADYDERGNPVLVGVRPDGRTTLGVAALSDGTRDQLYLSLRIASLEHHLETNPPLPFIVDDILVQFDDARAAAALQVLARPVRPHPGHFLHPPRTPDRRGPPARRGRASCSCIAWRIPRRDLGAGCP